MYETTMATKPEPMRRYFAALLQSEIAGWLDPVDAWILMTMNEELSNHPVLGQRSVCEIGVYQGLSAIALGFNGHLVACDLFGNTAGLSQANQQEFDTKFAISSRIYD
jgi:hypothetical protein